MKKKPKIIKAWAGFENGKLHQRIVGVLAVYPTRSVAREMCYDDIRRVEIKVLEG
jgi:hypothetical protein